MVKERVKSSKTDRLFDIINNSCLLLAFIVVLYPLLYIIICSFSTSLAIYSGKVWIWPVGFNLVAYREIFEYKPVLTGYVNTFFYTSLGTMINVICTIMAAYPLSRKDLVGRNLIMFIYTFTMVFNAGMIPTYLVIRNLGMLNTRWAMLIPQAVGVYYVIITRTFFQQNIAQDVLDAARIDGSDDIRFLFMIVLPLSGAVIAVITLFYAVFHWNAFFDAFIYLNERRLYPLQIFLREILIMNQIDAGMIVDPKAMREMEDLRELLKYALIIVSSVPILLLYPFIQKYFIRGVMLGSIKG